MLQPFSGQSFKRHFLENGESSDAWPRKQGLKHPRQKLRNDSHTAQSGISNHVLPNLTTWRVMVTRRVLASSLHFLSESLPLSGSLKSCAREYLTKPLQEERSRSIARKGFVILVLVSCAE
eukprot:481697-Amphidinium_carterae.1